MQHIVNVSGGLTSFEALRRCIYQHGKEHTIAVFADTTTEDPDLYRFLDDQERVFGIKIERVRDGRTPWQVMRDERCILLRLKDGTEVAPCSKKLKRELIDRWIEQNYPADTTIQVFGMDWTEMHRIERLQKQLAKRGITAWFPLTEPPLLEKCHIATYLESIGIATPALYTLGFEHNNCGGACIKGGQASWASLYYRLPERYARAEIEEEAIRQHLQKDIAILKDRRAGQKKPMTLRMFRERLECGDTNYDKDDWGGCGCFAP